MWCVTLFVSLLGVIYDIGFFFFCVLVQPSYMLLILTINRIMFSVLL